MTPPDAPAAPSHPSVEFVSTVPGFPGARRWTFHPLGEDPSPFAVMRCDDVDGLELVVAAPWGFFPSYEPDLDAASVASLDLVAAEDAAIWVVLTLGETPEATTANLMGPVVVNTRNGRAAQVVLHQPGLSTRVPLVTA